MIEQALYGGQDVGGYRFLARSPGFVDDWLPAAERLCTLFGERPAGISCPDCLFAQPFGPGHVAVVQVADQGLDDTGRPGTLGFHLLIVPGDLYAAQGGDPFRIAEQFPPPWETRGELPALTWSAGPPLPRTVAGLQKVLDVPRSATLLGGVQVLLDGGQLVFERTAPEPLLVRSLWSLLPASTRAELWPATFAFGNAHGFDVVVVPRAAGSEFTGYVHEEQAGDYPEGQYELRLQTAIEAGDQRELDALLLRRSRSQILRLALGLLAVFVLVPVGVVLFGPAPPPALTPAPLPNKIQSPNLPRPEECPKLSESERRSLAGQLQDLGRELRMTPPQGSDEAALGVALAALDERLGTPHPGRNPGPLLALGPLQRQLRALLWKQGVSGYDAPGLNLDEMLEKLRQHLRQTGVLPEGAGD